MSAQPYEIIAAPYTLYLAAVGTAFPDPGEAPAAGFTKIGSSGDLRYNEDGVTISLPQTIEIFRPVGSPRPVKAFRTEEDLMISLVLHDMRQEMMKYLLNGNALTDIAAASGVAGHRKLAIAKGGDVTQYAALLRGLSAYDDAMNVDWRVPRVILSGEPEIVGKKGEPAGLLFELQAIEDPDYAGGVFGEILMVDAVALP